MSQFEQLREDLINAALAYTSYVIERNGPGGHFSGPGYELGKAAEKLRATLFAAAKDNGSVVGVSLESAAQ